MFICTHKRRVAVNTLGKQDVSAVLQKRKALCCDCLRVNNVKIAFMNVKNLIIMPRKL